MPSFVESTAVFKSLTALCNALLTQPSGLLHQHVQTWLGTQLQLSEHRCTSWWQQVSAQLAAEVAADHTPQGKP